MRMPSPRKKNLSSPLRNPNPDMLDRIIKFFTSLRLTVVCLGFAVLLVFFGTLAQVNEGLYDAQNRWFRSLFVWWGPAGAGWKVPIFPGGYLLGTVLLINLI